MSDANMDHSSKNIWLFCPDVPDEVRVRTMSSSGEVFTTCVL